MAAPKTFTAVVGLSYPTGKGEARCEAGEKITDLPAKSVAWLREGGYILAPGDAAPEVAPEVAPLDDTPTPTDEQSA